MSNPKPEGHSVSRSRWRCPPNTRSVEFNDADLVFLGEIIFGDIDQARRHQRSEEQENVTWRWRWLVSVAIAIIGVRHSERGCVITLGASAWHLENMVKARIVNRYRRHFGLPYTLESGLVVL